MRNQFLAHAMAKSSLISLAVVIGLLVAASASATDPVYKWKDANGQSHYSQQPPDGVKYETIAPSGAPASSVDATAAHAADAAKPAPTATGAPTPAQAERQKLCDSARKNVDTLTTHPIVQMDLTGSGTPTTLTPAQQTQQLDIAKKQTASLCTN